MGDPGDCLWAEVTTRAEQGGLCLRVPAMLGLNGRSFQEWSVRLPVQLHGWGFRSMEENCGPAFLGTLETAIHFMTGRDGVCPSPFCRL